MIAANFGRLKSNDAKFRSAVAEYVKLNGLKRGRNKSAYSADLENQHEIAEKFKISEREVQIIMQLKNNLTPEIEQLLNNKKITKTTALSICSELTKEEQQELLKEQFWQTEKQ